MTNDWIPMDQYQDIMCCAVKRCRNDKDFIEVHKQLERTREHLIRNVEDFDVVIRDVEGLVVERKRELEGREPIMLLRLKELRAGRNPWFNEEPI